MKHQIEKPLEGRMKFFTPELYARFNSANDEIADRANQEWEHTVQLYQKHLSSIRDKMPSQVKKLSELCLHDAELLALEEDIEPFVPLPVEAHSRATSSWSAVAMLALRRQQDILNLTYVLWDRVGKYARKVGWRFSKSAKHWLYDEVDVVSGSRGMFLHRILFSDGTITELPFLSVCGRQRPSRQEGESNRVIC